MQRKKKPFYFIILTISLFALSVDRSFGSCPNRKKPETARGKCDCQRLESKRIVGGTQADLHEYPFQVMVASIYKTNRGTFQENCGGTLISHQWILTAAHCLKSAEFPRMKPFVEIRLGEHVKSTSQETAQTQIFYTRKFIIHERYRSKPIANDIALVYLSEPVKFSDAVSPACLPFDEVAKKDFKGEIMTAVGWGRNNKFNTKTSDTLKEVDLKVYSGQRCIFPKFRWSPKTVTKDMLCGHKRGQNVCSGDSGGPLIYNENGHTYVVGVASFVGGKTCVEKNLPGVFVRVASYLSWIQAKTGEKFCSV